MLKKIFYIFGNENKKYFILLFVFLLSVSLFEVLSIGSIFPLLNLLITQNTTNIAFLDKLFFSESLKNQSSLIYFLISIGILFLFKNIFLGLLHWYQIKFTQRISRNLQHRLLSNYLDLPLKEFLFTNSSLLIRNIDGEPKIVLKQFLIPIFQLIQEIFLSFGILLLLLISYPKLTGIIFLFFFIFILPIYYFSRKRIKILAKKRLEYIGKKKIYLRECIELIRDLKIYAKENFFNKRYIKFVDKMNYVNLLISFLFYFPKLFLETLVVIMGLIIMFVLIFIYGVDLTSLIPSLGLIGAILLRIIPSFIKIIRHYQTIDYSKPSVNLIYEILKNTEVSKSKVLKFDSEKFKKISIKNISYKYHEDYVIENLNFEIEKKDLVIIKGESGKGKTTFINILSGLIQPNKGKIFVNNKIYEYNKVVTSKFGYVGANNFFMDGSFAENITLKDRNDISKEELQKVKNCLDIVELPQFKDNIFSDVGERAEKISEGQKQRLCIARALNYEPEILIFDEATNSLDKETESKIFSNIYKHFPDITFIIITHRDLIISEKQKFFIFKDKKLTQQ